MDETINNNTRQSSLAILGWTCEERYKCLADQVEALVGHCLDYQYHVPREAKPKYSEGDVLGVGAEAR